MKTVKKKDTLLATFYKIIGQYNLQTVDRTENKMQTGWYKMQTGDKMQTGINMDTYRAA